MEVWGQTAREAGLSSAQIYRPHISRQGLIVQVE